MTIPSGCSTATLSFYLHIDTAETTTSTAYDTLKVQVLNSSGTVLATLATYSNLNAASGYTQRSFSLGALRRADGHAQVHRHRGLHAPDVVRHRRHGAQRQLSPQTTRRSPGPRPGERRVGTPSRAERRLRGPAATGPLALGPRLALGPLLALALPATTPTAPRSGVVLCGPCRRCGDGDGGAGGGLAPVIRLSSASPERTLVVVRRDAGVGHQAGHLAALARAGRG